MRNEKRKTGLRFDHNDNGPMTAAPQKVFAEDNSILVSRTRRTRLLTRAGFRLVVIH